MNDSIKPFSIGFPGRMKSMLHPCGDSTTGQRARKIHFRCRRLSHRRLACPRSMVSSLPPRLRPVSAVRVHVDALGDATCRSSTRGTSSRRPAGHGRSPSPRTGWGFGTSGSRCGRSCADALSFVPGGLPACTADTSGSDRSASPPVSATYAARCVTDAAWRQFAQPLSQELSSGPSASGSTGASMLAAQRQAPATLA